MGRKQTRPGNFRRSTLILIAVLCALCVSLVNLFGCQGYPRHARERVLQIGMDTPKGNLMVIEEHRIDYYDRKPAGWDRLAPGSMDWMLENE